MCDQQSLRSACAYAQSDQSLCLSLEYSMTVRLLTEHHLEFLSLKGGCTVSSESTLVKMSHCRKSRHGSIICFHFFFFLVDYNGEIQPQFYHEAGNEKYKFYYHNPSSSKFLFG